LLLIGEFALLRYADREEMRLETFAIGGVCLVSGFAGGHYCPAPRYIHIGAITMYNERTGHICDVSKKWNGDTVRSE